jgi:hypothetical protein
VVITCKLGCSSPPYCTVIRCNRSRVTLLRCRGREIHIPFTKIDGTVTSSASGAKFWMLRNRIRFPANRSTLTYASFWPHLLGLPECLGRTSDTRRRQLGSATIEVSVGRGSFDLPRESIVTWPSKGAQAVAHYYGVFPVHRSSSLLGRNVKQVPQNLQAE